MTPGFMHGTPVESLWTQAVSLLTGPCVFVKDRSVTSLKLYILSRVTLLVNEAQSVIAEAVFFCPEEKG